MATRLLVRVLAALTLVVGILVAAGPGLAMTRPASASPNTAGWGPPHLANQPQGHVVSVSCPTTSYCVALDGVGNALAYDGTTWSVPNHIDLQLFAGGEVPEAQSVSCASASFCVAVDTIGAEGASFAEVFDGASWTAPVQIDSRPVQSVSCATPSRCVAVDTMGNAMTFDGVTWSAPVVAAPGVDLFSVSCVSASWCMAVGGGNGTRDAFRFDGKAWSPAPGAGTRLMDHVSCTSTSWCMATGGRFGASYDGTWAKPVAVVPGRNPRRLTVITALSCVSPTMCVAANINRALMFDGSSWTYPSEITWRHLDTRAISCVTTTWCLAGGDHLSHPAEPGYGNGFAAVFNGAGWSAQALVARINTGLTSVACPQPSRCLGVSYGGYAVAGDHAVWGSPVRIDPVGFLDSVSCPSTSFCAAVDQLGNAVTYDGSAWSEPTAVDPSQGLNYVSCTSASFCVAVDDDGNAVVFNGTSWSNPSNIASPYFSQSVSCASATFCMAIGYGGVGGGIDVATFNGTAWSGLAGIGSSGPVSVSCESSVDCVAVNGADAEVYNGSTWSAPQGVDPGSGDLVSISCTSTCAAVDQSGHAFRYVAGVWTGPTQISSTVLDSVSCVGPAFCVAADRNGFAVTHSG